MEHNIKKSNSELTEEKFEKMMINTEKHILTKSNCESILKGIKGNFDKCKIINNNCFYKLCPKRVD